MKHAHLFVMTPLVENLQNLRQLVDFGLVESKESQWGRLLFTVFALSAGDIYAQSLFTPGGLVAQSSTGYVGIGTSSPSTQLEVVGDFSVKSGDTWQTSLFLGNLSSNKRFQFIVGGSGNNIGAAGIGGFGIYDSVGGFRLNINSNGNVGIGTTNADTRLSVLTPLRGTDGLMIQRSGGAFLRFAPDADAGNWTSLTQTGDSALIFSSGAPNSGGIVLAPWNSGTNVGLRMNSSGHVGIGTPSPAEKLSVVGKVSSNGLVVDSLADGEGFYFKRGAFQGWNGGAYSDNTFRINQAGVAARLLIDSSGNIGIGTTSPTHKLSVNGSIRAKEVIVETTGWADYVFAPGYALPTLAETEQHIAAHGHLPGIPSATEVAEQGVSVGDLQVKLLQKLEEMTLHQIEMQKTIVSLQKRISELEISK